MNHRLNMTVFLGLSILATSTYAYAEDEAPVAPPQPITPAPPSAPSRHSWTDASTGDRIVETKQWYGWQTLIGVGIFDVMAIVGTMADNRTIKPSTQFKLQAIGMTGRVLVAPTVHWVHGHGKRGFGSLGLNVGGPLAGLALGAGVGVVLELNRSSGNAGYLLIGLGAGVSMGCIAATVLDTVFLSTDTVKIEHVNNREVMPFSLAFAPMLGAHTAGMSAIGQF